MDAKSDFNRGLCKSCDNCPECVYYRQNPHRYVTQCDEYKCEGALVASPGIRKVGSPDHVRSSMRVSEEVEPGQPLGLCKSCKTFESCTFPKPEGGVWHCLEYE